jgi:hypothetical protein
MSTRIRASNQEKISPRLDLVLLEIERYSERKEFGGCVGLSVLSLRLVPWRNQVLHELASEISLVIDF